MKPKLEKKSGVITDVKIYTDNKYIIKGCAACHKMSDLTEKPKGMPDMVLVTAKAGAKVVTEMFPVLIKYDGTLEAVSLAKHIRGLRERFMAFLKHYGMTEKIKGYNILKNVANWKGKKVDVVTYLTRTQIFIPGHLIRL